MRNSQSPKISSGTYRTVEVPTTGFLSSHRTNFWLAIHPPNRLPWHMVCTLARWPRAPPDVGRRTAFSGLVESPGGTHETRLETDSTQAPHSDYDGSLLPA